MKPNEEETTKTLDKIKMSDEKRAAIKHDKKGFIKQTAMMFKLWTKLCKKCKKKIYEETRSGRLNKVTGEEMKSMFCDKCKLRYDKVTK